MIGAILSWVWPYIAGLLAVVAALFAARKSGIKAEKRKQIEARLTAIKNKQEVKQNAENLTDDALVAGSVRKRDR